MAESPLQTLRFKIIFAGCWSLWSVMHMMLLYVFGFSWSIAVWDSMVSNFFLAMASLLVVTVLKYYLPHGNRYGYLLGFCSMLAAIWLFITRLILPLAVSDLHYYRFYLLSLPVRLAIAFLTLTCMALLSVLWYTIKDQQDIEKRKVEAEKLSRDAELYKLRQQLQPHFLFNSLNSINALIGQQPERARYMVQHLSDFLRGTLKKEENQWVFIEEELQQVLLYLDIEKVRFGHRLAFKIQNDCVTGKLSLPSMLLQPIVENAIKFGLYGTIGEIMINISARVAGNHLEVCVINPFDPSETTMAGTGFGLRSVQRRLYLLFARNDLLKTDRKDQFFITTILIPQQL